MKHDYSKGRVFKGKFGVCKVLKYNNARDVLVEFEDGFIRKCASSSLVKGDVKNPNFPTIFGVGYLGSGKFSEVKDVSKTYAYKIWRHMLERCFSKGHEKAYSDCTVCNEWLCFNNFATWCHNQHGFNTLDEDGNRLHLDKDFKKKGNRVYSPETCIFIPKKINQAIVNRRQHRGGSAIGVVKTKYGKFHSQILINGVREHGKSYDNMEDAFDEYKQKKEKYLKDLANEHSECLGVHAVEVVCNYKVEIND